MNICNWKLEHASVNGIQPIFENVLWVSRKVYKPEQYISSQGRSSG